MDDLEQRLHEAACGTGDGDMADLLREAAAALESALEDVEHFRWLGQCPNAYTVVDLLRAGEYVTLRRACEALRGAYDDQEARNG